MWRSCIYVYIRRVTKPTLCMLCLPLACMHTHTHLCRFRFVSVHPYPFRFAYFEDINFSLPPSLPPSFSPFLLPSLTLSLPSLPPFPPSSLLHLLPPSLFPSPLSLPPLPPSCLSLLPSLPLSLPPTDLPRRSHLADVMCCLASVQRATDIPSYQLQALSRPPTQAEQVEHIRRISAASG